MMTKKDKLEQKETKNGQTIQEQKSQVKMSKGAS